MAAQTPTSSSKAFPAQSISLNDLGLIPQPSVAKLLGKSLRTVQRMTERGELPPTISLARDQYYRHESILSKLAERERKAAQQKLPRTPRRRRTGGGAR
jgi:predicted DNA-binding transcriptional regulator AlpA